jgi:5-methylcytosine-specific restriction enzyme A
MEPFFQYVDQRTIKQEKEKARELRRSQWWKKRKSTGICHYCRNRFHPSELTMDHIVPIARGGKSVKNNIVPCCKKCNSEKQNRTPVEWDNYGKSH